VVTTNFEACAGEVTSLDANIVGQSEFTTISWFDSGGNLISDPNNVQLPSNDGCAPINIDYTIEVSCTQNPDFVTLTDVISITVYPTDVSAFVTPIESQCEAMLAIDESCSDLVTFNPVSFNPGESGTVDLTVNYNNNCVSSFTVSVNYNCAAIMGCTDPCAPNFDPLAMENDGSCEPYNNTCNQDCGQGPFGGIWDINTCSCIDEIVPVNGCMDMNACNFDTSANCDDGSCDYGNTACTDPCNEPNPDDGCDITTDSFDEATCTVTNEPDCPANTTFNANTCYCDTDVIFGCMDVCAPNFNSLANEDDGSCEPYDNTCNDDCTLGPFGGTWDPVLCDCIEEIDNINGCIDVNACNYNAMATCDDDSCDYGNDACDDPCNEPNPDDGCDLTTDSFDAATCTVTNTPNCATDETFNPANCQCVTVAVDGCTDPCDPAYDPESTNDVLCIGYSTECNTDCTLGTFGGTWDTVTCACINEITPLSGCADATACNYDATANCNDDSCVYGNVACPDPCNEPNPDDGCDITTDSFDEATCMVTNEPDCPANTTFNSSTCNCDTDMIPGCTDACAPNFNPLANQDDGTCARYDRTCNEDCKIGPFGGTYDDATCGCINEITPVNGCTDSTACNYDASANCNDDSCVYGNLACADPCNEPNPDDGCDITIDSFDTATCTVTNEPDCPANTTFNASTCNCDTADVIPGCTDPCAPNFNPLANQDDGSCGRYDGNCNEDCTLGPFGGTWDPMLCECINEIDPVNGCTDVTACNYDASANCSDDRCIIGNLACADPCNEPNPDDGCDITTDSFDAATCAVINEPDCPANTVFNANTCNCDMDMIPGCTDSCAPNFNPDANFDDDSCESYEATCNEDCTTGPFGGAWDTTTCSCINEIAPVNGCTDATACNYDATANCDDISCLYGNDACADPCFEPNIDDGCDITIDSFDAATCTVINEPDCPANTEFEPATCECLVIDIDGCTDPCDPNYNPLSVNDVLCAGYSTDCNIDCTQGPFGGTWDASTCSCINEITPVYGCTDSTDPNYNPAANCDDGSCSSVMCDDPCAPNFGTAESCEPYDTTCNEDCATGPFGGTWDASTCSCINEITPVNGCTDANACNYNASANCDDDSCDYGNDTCSDPCNEPNPDDGCDLTTDSFDAATCTVINEPNCPTGRAFNTSTCNCDERNLNVKIKTYKTINQNLL